MEQYSEQLAKIEHFQKYPTLIPWVGENYRNTKNKMVILGESHYLPEYSNCHHDPESWYEGINVLNSKELSWMNTAGIIKNGINRKGWKAKGHRIYTNLSRAMKETKIEEFDVEQPFNQISYLNYFQRPAEVSGNSIKVSKLDSRNSADTVKSVIQILKPGMVVFCSSKAGRYAKNAGLWEELMQMGIKSIRVPHAAMPWWNRASKKYNNLTGKQYFIEQLKSFAR